jgi:hypothetical protein
MERIFTYIYESKCWGDNKNTNYAGSSGAGSDVYYNKKYIEIVKNIIKDYKINNVVDLGCGDFMIGRLLYDDINVLYTGYDTYKKIIDYHMIQYPEPKYTFKHLDFYTYKESIVEGDMCILKDVIQHWTIEEIYFFLDYLVESKKFKYILLVNCCNQKKNDETCNTGEWRPLSINFLPLKKYNPIKIDSYHNKEISIIKV